MFYPEQTRVRIGLIIAALGFVGVVILTAVIALVCWKCSNVVASSAETLAVIGWSASLLTAIFGSVFGASLALQNDGHLEVAWTRPISRTAMAIRILATDLAGIAGIFALAWLAGYVIASLLEGKPVALPTDTASLVQLARFVAFPLAMFGLTQALSAGIKSGNYGWAVGPVWPVTMGLFALLLLPLAGPWRGIVQALNTVNPIMYFPYWEFDETIWHTYRFGYGVAIDTLALFAIACVGVIVALARWRRVEA